MRLHKEGTVILWLFSLGAIALSAILFFALFNVLPWLFYFLEAALLVFMVLVFRFFRVPKRNCAAEDNIIYAPCDGKVVVIEETEEGEYLKDNRIQVSIFMSPLNVHVNYYPVNGEVSYTQYHPGKYLVAWHPKSSTENERSTVVVKTKNGVEVLFRQIAGAVARRIITYSKVGKPAKAGDEMGFIKFGSRIDVFLPKNAEILAQLEQKTVATQTPIARLK